MNLTATSFWSRYRSLMIAVAVFLFLDLAVLVFSAYLSQQVARDTQVLQIERRLRVLNEDLTTRLVVIDRDRAKDLDVDPDELAEVKDDVKEFNELIDTLVNGGSYMASNKKAVQISPFVSQAGKQAVAGLYADWRFIDTLLKPVLGTEEINDDDLNRLVDYLRDNRGRLTSASDELSHYVQTVSTANANRLRLVQTAGLAFAVLNFVYIVFVSVRRLIGTDRKIAEAQKETDDILSNVREGLFLLDAGYRIGDRRSASLKAIFQRDIAVGTEFLDLLRTLVAPDMVENTKAYIELLFAGRVKENLVQSLNPLSEVEVRPLGDDGRAVTTPRWLSFQFNRVIESGKIAHLLVTVQDATQRVQLGRELEESKGRARQELEVYLQLLTREPASLQQFIVATQNGLETINQALRNASKKGAAEDYMDVVQFAFRTVHAIKGEASVLRLDLFESLAHSFEEELVALRNAGTLRGDDMLKLTLRLDDFFERLTTVSTLLEQMQEQPATTAVGAAGAADAAAPKAAMAAAGDWGQSLSTLVARVADNQQKKVHLQSSLGAIGLFSEARQAELREIVVQLLRNAVVHGIETPDERRAGGKSDVGNIQLVSSVCLDGEVELTVRDDGRGIRAQDIRDALIHSGALTELQAAALSDREVVMKIFEPGISTTVDVDSDSGRGVGMDLVRDRVRQLQGRLSMKSKANAYTVFTVRLAVS